MLYDTCAWTPNKVFLKSLLCNLGVPYTYVHLGRRLAGWGAKQGSHDEKSCRANSITRQVRSPPQLKLCLGNIPRKV